MKTEPNAASMQTYHPVTKNVCCHGVQEKQSYLWCRTAPKAGSLSWLANIQSVIRRVRKKQKRNSSAFTVGVANASESSGRYRRLWVGIFLTISYSLLIVSHKCSSASLSAASLSPINHLSRLKASEHDPSLYILLFLNFTMADTALLQVVEQATSDFKQIPIMCVPLSLTPTLFIRH